MTLLRPNPEISYTARYHSKVKPSPEPRIKNQKGKGSLKVSRKGVVTMRS